MTPADLKTLGDAVCAALEVKPVRERHRVHSLNHVSSAFPTRAEAEAQAELWNRQRRHNNEYRVSSEVEYPPVSESDGVCVEVLVPALVAKGWTVTTVSHTLGTDTVLYSPGEEYKRRGKTLAEAVVRCAARALCIDLSPEAP